MFRPRRMTSPIPHMLYVGMGIALIAVALPRLPRIRPDASGAFACVWLLFGLVVIGANLWFVLAVPCERGERHALGNRAPVWSVVKDARGPETDSRHVQRLGS
ncbi:MAG: hypothetical protein OWT27_03715 [Firmicutes bacterium]|nr:hypothetical protein [Bacillota bacterium]